MSHWRHRPDGNSKAIQDAFKALGFSVWPINDVIDLLVGYGGYTRLIEVRPEGKKAEPREGRQKRFHDYWTGGVYWIQTADDVLVCANSMKLHVEILRNGMMKLPIRDDTGGYPTDAYTRGHAT